MPAFLAAAFGFLGSTVAGLFGFKGEQAKTVQSAISLVESINNTDSATITAQANAISAVLTQGSWIEKQWRPLLMMSLIGIIGAWFFGFIPPNFDQPVSPMMREVLDLLKIGVMGYVPARSIEKIITSMNISSIVKQLINKKVL